MAISLVKPPTGNPSFNLLKKPPKQKQFNIGIDEPPGGLVPLGDTGLWTTPDEPADPQDCERWEGSAFCTPFFFTFTPFSFEPAIAVDECNIGIRLDYSFGFIRLPPVAIVYRDPSDACRLPPPPEPPPLGNNDLVPFPFNSCSVSTTSLVIYGLSSGHSKAEWVDPVTKEYYHHEASSSNTITSIEFPYTGNIGRYIDANGIERTTYAAKIETTYIARENYSAAWGDAHRRGTDPNKLHNETELNSQILVFPSGSAADNNIVTAKVFGKMMGVIEAKEQLKGLRNISESKPHIGYTADNEPVIDGYDSGEQNFFIKIICGVGQDYKNNPPPPANDNPPPRRCCMNCCPSQGEQDNSLLNLLIQKVDKLSSVVGVNEYPISVPSTFISKDEGFFGNLLPNKNVKLTSLSTFLAWYVERFDEIMGMWEIPIEIKDSDPSKPGEQPVGIKLPNIAECMAELFTLCFQTNINSETLLNMSMRNLAETGADKQQNFVTYKLLQSLTDWVGYKQKDTQQKMPLTFTPGKTRYDEILKECEVDVSVPEFDEKFGLEADLMRFREAASILQANHKIKIDPNGNVKAQILKYLIDTFKSVAKVNGEDGEQDFEDFLEQVEQGFINTRGIKDNVNPYGRPFNERPRIRDLTNFETDNPTP
jgi:hypothetical protein